MDEKFKIAINLQFNTVTYRTLVHYNTSRLIILSLVTLLHNSHFTDLISSVITLDYLNIHK